MADIAQSSYVKQNVTLIKQRLCSEDSLWKVLTDGKWLDLNCEAWNAWLRR